MCTCHASLAEPVPSLPASLLPDLNNLSHNSALNQCTIVLRSRFLLVLDLERSLSAQWRKRCVVTRSCCITKRSLSRGHPPLGETTMQNLRKACTSPSELGHGNVKRQSIAAVVVLPRLKSQARSQAADGQGSPVESGVASGAQPLSCLSVVCRVRPQFSIDTPGVITCYIVIGIHDTNSRL